MARKRVGSGSDDRGVVTGVTPGRNLRHDLAVNLVLAGAAGLLALVIMLLSGTEWSLVTQVTVAAIIALLVFLLAVLLIVVPQLLWGEQ